MAREIIWARESLTKSPTKNLNDPGNPHPYDSAVNCEVSPSTKILKAPSTKILKALSGSGHLHAYVLAVHSEASLAQKNRSPLGR